jgi:hypothetical protein
MNILNRLLIWLLTINCCAGIIITAVGAVDSLVRFVGSDVGFYATSYLAVTSFAAFALLVRRGVL